MDKKIDATRLLRAMGDVDDKYIEEALGASGSASRRAVTTSLRRYSGIIGAVAAALLLFVAGGFLLRLMSSTQSAPDTGAVQAHNAAVSAEIDEADRVNTYAGSANEEALLSADVAPQVTQADVEAIDGPAQGDNSNYSRSVNPMVELSDLAALSEASGFDIEVPDAVADSVSREYYFYDVEDGLVEIRYLDAEGNEVCAIRKAPGDDDISGVYACFSILTRCEVDGLEHVNLYGSRQGYVLATWIQGEYSYSVNTAESISEQAMLELISGVS